MMPMGNDFVVRVNPDKTPETPDLSGLTRSDCMCSEALMPWHQTSLAFTQLKNTTFLQPINSHPFSEHTIKHL